MRSMTSTFALKPAHLDGGQVKADLGGRDIIGDKGVAVRCVLVCVICAALVPILGLNSCQHNLAKAGACTRAGG